MDNKVMDQTPLINRYKALYQKAQEPQKTREYNPIYRGIIQLVESAISGCKEEAKVSYPNELPTGAREAIELLKEDGFIVSVTASPNNHAHSTVKTNITVTVSGWSN